MIHQPGETADRAVWGVTRCACGVYRVKLGAMQLELEPHEFFRLAQLLASAVQHFRGDDEREALAQPIAH